MKSKIAAVLLVLSTILISCSREKEVLYKSAEYDIYAKDNYVYIQVHDLGAFEVSIPILTKDKKIMTVEEYYSIINKEGD